MSLPRTVAVKSIVRDPTLVAVAFKVTEGVDPASSMAEKSASLICDGVN